MVRPVAINKEFHGPARGIECAYTLRCHGAKIVGPVRGVDGRVQVSPLSRIDTQDENCSYKLVVSPSFACIGIFPVMETYHLQLLPQIMGNTSPLC